ncbi:hypothetical protein LAYK3_03650 [Lactobacillus amylovorus subsp. amylovorus]|nr:hypothetical protein LAYK3_03650 [Lactobacillus amylovorus]GMM22109.1 hypothetical protein LAYK10_14200 [Lactobacillus amylovorus]
MTANEQIIALVKPEYLKKIPKIFRGYADIGYKATKKSIIMVLRFTLLLATTATC